MIMGENEQCANYQEFGNYSIDKKSKSINVS